MPTMVSCADTLKPACAVGADLVGAGRRAAAGAGHEHAVRPGLFHAHLAEVAGHVRQQVAAPDRRSRTAAARRPSRGVTSPPVPGRLGDDEAAVGAALDDRVADVRPVGHRGPVGVQAAGGLAAAFDDVAGEAARGEPVEVVGRPAELVHQHAERHRAVDAAAGDDDVGARVQRRARSAARRGRRWRSPAVRAAARRWTGRPRRLLRIAAASGSTSSPVDHRDRAPARPSSSASACTAAAQPCGFTPPALLTTRMPCSTTSLQHRAQRHRDEVGGVAQLRPLHARAPRGSTSSARRDSRTPGSRCRRARTSCARRPGCCRPRSPRRRRCGRPCRGSRFHLPVHCGFLFSLNAAMPSRASCVMRQQADLPFAERDRLLEGHRAHRLHRVQAAPQRGGRVGQQARQQALERAVEVVRHLVDQADLACPRGIDRVARQAQLRQQRCGTRACSTASTCIGNTPTFASGRPKIACGAAMARSHIASRPMPPAMQAPLTRAMSGTLSVRAVRSRSA